MFLTKPVAMLHPHVPLNMWLAGVHLCLFEEPKKQKKMKIKKKKEKSYPYLLATVKKCSSEYSIVGSLAEVPTNKLLGMH